MELFTIVLLVVVLAEVTYLINKQSQKTLTKTGRPIFVDTSALIDGRLMAVARSGFIGDTLIIPRSVVGELQFLADNADSEKRTRARHGLDVVHELQSLPSIKVEILQDGSKAEEGVDERLLKLAKQYTGAICTVDFNLNKVAQVENIPVLNVNELAQTLRMAHLPGERMTLAIMQKGQDVHQGVGYLPDGTMVVVEHAASKIGKTAEIEFIRSLQTAAGKMMFARLAQVDNPQKHQKNTSNRGRSKIAAEVPAGQKKPGRKLSVTSKNNRPKTSAQRESDLIAQINQQ